MKYYVVFRGFNPGVYDTWEEVQEQTNGFPGALFKSYASSEEAAEAYRSYAGSDDIEDLARILFKKNDSSEVSASKPATPSPFQNPEIDWNAWAVDASCLGNPGKMEYRGVEVSTGKIIFRQGPFEDATNNIGEYLALVHAMALIMQRGEVRNIYSDSATAIAWWKKRKINTKLQPTEKNKKIFELLARASVWVNTHTFPGKVMKWQTDRWGEIPADFGRK